MSRFSLWLQQIEEFATANVGSRLSGFDLDLDNISAIFVAVVKLGWGG